MDILDILKEIEKAKGSRKQKVLAKYKDHYLLKKVWHLCYGRHNYRTKKQVDVSKCKGSSSYIDMIKLLECLINGGDKANSLIKYLEDHMITHFSPNVTEVFNRIISGNLRTGIGATVANKVWGKDFISKYPVMLLSAYCPKKAKKIMESGKAVLQLKSDGVRGISELRPEDVKFFSRNGEEFHCLGNFKPIIRKLVRYVDSDATDAMVDGEFSVIEDGVYNPSKASGILNKCIKGTATEDEVDSLTYVVWDLVLPTDEDEGITYNDRLPDLKSSVHLVGSDKLGMVDSWEVDSLEDVVTKYRKVVDQGNEGVVLKSLDNVWKPTRVSDCIKYKEKHSGSFKIVSWYRGDSGKEFQNVLGGFHVESEDGMVVSKTGSGLSFEDRGIFSNGVDKKGKPVYPKDANGNYIPVDGFEEFCNNYISQIVEMEYNKRSKTRDGRETYSLRFPIIKEFRCDKDEADTLHTLVSEEALSRGLKL